MNSNIIKLDSSCCSQWGKYGVVYDLSSELQGTGGGTITGIIEFM